MASSQPPIRLPSHKQPGDEANCILNQIAIIMESSATTPNSRVNVMYRLFRT